MGLEVKSFESPDETRPFEGKGQADIVVVGDKEVGRFTGEPGWKWSENVKPIAETDSCEVDHCFYVVSGQMKITMDDGAENDVGPGDVASVSPGHNAEVVGDENCVLIDFGKISEYAKR